MGVGSVKGGGRSGGAKGPKGAKGVGAGKAGSVGGSAGVAPVDKAEKFESLVGPSGAAGTSEVAPAAATSSPVVQFVNTVTKSLQAGNIGQAQATQMLVSFILKEKMKVQSKVIEGRIAEQIEADPHLSKTLKRIWGSG